MDEHGNQTLTWCFAESNNKTPVTNSRWCPPVRLNKLLNAIPGSMDECSEILYASQISRLPDFEGLSIAPVKFQRLLTTCFENVEREMRTLLPRLPACCKKALRTLMMANIAAFKMLRQFGWQISNTRRIPYISCTGHASTLEVGHIGPVSNLLV